MVVIRLSRGGANKRPFYSIVVADSREARDGRYIEQLGYFNPIAKGGEQRLVIAQERVEHWQSQGAQPSPRVMSLLKQYKSQSAEENKPVVDKKAKKATKTEAQSKAKPKKEAKVAEENPTE